MKKLLFFLFGFLIAVPGLSCRNESETTDQRLFVDYQYHFKLPLPPGWTATDSTGLQDVLVAACAPDTISGFVPNLTITLERLDSVCTAAEYAARSLQKLRNVDFLPLRLEEFCSAKTKFYHIESRSGSANLSLRIINYFLVRDRDAFIFTGVVPDDATEAYRPAFQKMLDGFEFLQ